MASRIFDHKKIERNVTLLAVAAFITVAIAKGATSTHSTTMCHDAGTMPGRAGMARDRKNHATSAQITAATPLETRCAGASVAAAPPYAAFPHDTPAASAT